MLAFGMGRPSDYVPDEHPAAVIALARNAKTQLEIAETLGISLATFKNWLNSHPEFLAAYALGKEAAIDRVERALFERAIGYSHPAEKIVVVNGGPGMGSSIERVETVEHYPPDPAAMKMLLNNRRSADWRERQEVQHSGDVNITGFAEALNAGLKRAAADKPSDP